MRTLRNISQRLEAFNIKKIIKKGGESPPIYKLQNNYK